ncbi:MAG: glutamine-synthetase adenylyltransferase [Rhodobacteraceae bacterium]|jgi:glutamate-ammonia-ligase adenylyltransferase|uniref:[protein-PII] uridylyltransferase family protein n=1 Tax=Planktotalea sp. TaxID=2029877 RepID=UPI0002DF0A3D|nr:glutamine-synthetase adenylyltransferase [Planktotalea sp.]MBT5823209.1 glutamine-synthetase adenylyltransferase [Paracoccaceae bacterium]MDG1085780.1 glutamine-synthetase adenylyltransferase [Planktotalea sp.]HCW82567.1 glutamine-synthetase adenylyltransferase [Paracoccaceae bacterium]
MSSFLSITRVPTPFDASLGQEALGFLPALDGQLRELVLGAAGCSPYLKSLIAKEFTWLEEALDDPDAAVEILFAYLPNVEAKTMPTALRQAKRRIALITGLADLGGVWLLEKVTTVLTDFADLAVTCALRTTIGAEIARGKLPGMDESNIADAGGMSVLAMGKMGAHELNYSSDIDLICLFDETRFAPDDFHDARASFVRATRRMAAMLNDLTGEGYVFRTDLRLRPDPGVTPVCIAMEAAERYYESLGRTWERAAYIKARPCAGDLQAGAGFLKTLTPFVWRKHLDFAAIQDAHDMRLRYREHKGLGGKIKLAEHNMKLGRGGIREIEFFTQTRQIIAGGRDPELRVRGTVEGLEILRAKGWVPDEAAAALTDHYRAHREVEHRLQMFNDAQTHTLPKSDEGFVRLAAFMGREEAELRKDLMTRLQAVHDLTEGFFAPDAAQLESDHSFDETVIERWQTYPALRSERAVEIFQRLKPDVLKRLSKTTKPNESLLAFDGFLAGLPAGVQLFSLFEANPQLIDLLIDIVGTAPALARHLSRNAGVFDGVIAGSFFADWPGVDSLSSDLSEVLGRETDYERKLDATRRWAKEWHFGVGVHHLRGLVDADQVAMRYAELAEGALRALWPHVVAQFATKHGDMPGRGAVIVGMGSLGAGRLNATSDLDLIIIYDADGVEMSTGKRSLPVRQYYARLTQAMVTAMTAPMAQGRLYEVDMRLRPSGTQGPVATSWQSFQDYQKNQAWLWEHLALTRARVVVGSEELARDVDDLRVSIVQRSRDPAIVLSEVAKMRARIQAAKQAQFWDGKLGAGRLQDIELIGQAGLLGAGNTARDIETGLQECVALGWMDAAQSAALSRSYRLFWHIQLVTKLLSETVIDDAHMPESIGQGGLAFLLRESEFDTLAALRAGIERIGETAAIALESVLPDIKGAP